MLTAKYPHIANKRTTVKFMVEGLREHHQLKDVIRALNISGLRNTIDELYERLQDIEEENVMADPTQTAVPQGASPGKDYRNRQQRNQHPCRAPHDCEDHWRRGRGRGRWSHNGDMNVHQNCTNCPSHGRPQQHAGRTRSPKARNRQSTGNPPGLISEQHDNK